MPKKNNPHVSPTPLEQRRMQMADVARLAGVSTSTVSRALSGSKLVNEETRYRIEELARSLSYTVNISAQNLRMKQNRTVAVVIPYDGKTRQPLSDPFFLSMLGSIADALTERGFDMLLSRVDSEELYSASQPYDTGRAIGIILIASRKVPIVVWGAQLPQQLYITIGSDNVSGGFLATEHLILTGRKQIAFFGDIQLPEIGQRYEGYCKALAQYKIKLNPQLFVAASFSEDGASLALKELQSRKVKFNGLFACSDLLATTVINTLRDQQVQVPQDVAVVGYDDIEQARYFHPPLTTIRQPMQLAGQTLVNALLDIVEGKAYTPQLLPTQLITRSSG